MTAKILAFPVPDRFNKMLEIAEVLAQIDRDIGKRANRKRALRDARRLVARVQELRRKRATIR